MNKYQQQNQPHSFSIFMLKRRFSKICSVMGCLPPLFPLDVILDVVEMEVKWEVVCQVGPKEDVGSVSIIPDKSLLELFCDALNQPEVMYKDKWTAANESILIVK